MDTTRVSCQETTKKGGEATDTRSLVWVDVTGNKTVNMVRTSAGGGAIMADMVACSNADWLSWWESAQTDNGAPAPVVGTYQPVGTRAALTFLCADNTLATLVIPAPKGSIFLADGETVDPANALVLALVADSVGNLVSSTGSLAVSFAGGSLLPRTKQPL